MLGRDIVFGLDARNKILEGVSLLEKSVITTLGPKGRNVLIDKGTVKPVITKDGVTVAKNICFSDKYRNIGSTLVKEAANKANTVAGDGSTTTTLLTSELMKEGNRLVAVGFDPNDIRKGMNIAREDILNELENSKRVLSTEEEIFNIAKISANNDSEIAGYIKEAFTGIGDDGIVTIKNANNKQGNTSVEFTSGLELDKGFISSAFINKPDETCEFENAVVLLVEKFPNKWEEMLQIVNYCDKNEKPLFIVAAYYEEDIYASLVKMANDSNIDICAINAPGHNKDTINDSLEDLSIMFNCKILGNKGYDIQKFNPVSDLGKVDSIKCYKNKTTFTGAQTDAAKLEEHINKLKEALSKADSDDALTEHEIENLKQRLAKLSGGVACIKVGAFSLVELEEKMDRYDDATNAVRAAINEGIVPGGGTTLLRIAHKLRESLSKKKFETDVEKKGYEAVLTAICRPAEMIIKSTGKNDQLVISKILENKSSTCGYNAKKEEIVKDLFEEGIIDPVKVEKAAITYAISVASMFITTDCIITDEDSNVSVQANDELMAFENEDLFGDRF